MSDEQFTSALYQMIQRIDGKIDDLREDLSTVKSKQSVIESSLHDHITKSECIKLEAKQEPTNILNSGFVFKYIIPFTLSVLMLGRMSVGMTSAYSAPVYSTPVPAERVYVDHNKRIDSLLQSELLKYIPKEPK